MFITFEGSEGSGKSTQYAALSGYLKELGYPVLATREPGGTTIGDQIRSVLLNLENTDMQPRTEILLFQASRAQLVDQVLLPHLKAGGVVISDRYADSTLAYQGFGYQLDLVKLRAIVDFATGGLKPDLTLFLDVDVEEGLRRRARGGNWNRLDAQDIAFYQRVRQGYHQLVREEPQRWVVIDAGQSPGEVQAAVRSCVMGRLAAARPGRTEPGVLTKPGVLRKSG